MNRVWNGRGHLLCRAANVPSVFASGSPDNREEPSYRRSPRQRCRQFGGKPMFWCRSAQ
jgi:hypothetical protein